MGIQNKLIQIFIALVGIFLALWLVMSSVTLQEEYQIAILITTGIIALLYLIRRDLPFDFKLLCLLLLGYSLAGKGFAYLTPFEPVYIGEITMVVAMLGLVFRYMKGAEFMPTLLHWLLFGWMAVVGLYLIASFEEHRLMAIRDSAMGYYAIFFFTSFAVFRNRKAAEAFASVLKVAVVLGMISSLLFTLLWEFLGVNSGAARFFSPHPDAFIPLIVAGAVYGLVRGMSQRNIFLLAAGGIGLMIVLINKTAGAFSFIIVLAVLIVFAKRMELLFASVMGIALGAVIIGIFLASGSSFVEEKIFESDQVQTLQDIGQVTGKENSSTSDWRISWWSIIIEDTMAENPWTGVGMGGDISGHFVESVLRIDLMSETAKNFARYPHNIVFTVFGRMGILGLALFSIPFTAIIVFGIRFFARHLRTDEEQRQHLIPAVIFFAGLTNSLVQATYEVPYGAVTHWACLGYLAAVYYPVRNRQLAQPSLRSRPQKPHGMPLENPG